MIYETIAGLAVWEGGGALFMVSGSYQPNKLGIS